MCFRLKSNAMMIVVIVSVFFAVLSLMMAIVSLTASMRYSRRLSEWSQHVIDEANRCICVNCQAIENRIKILESHESCPKNED